jgi:hypothetical protein
MMCGCRHVILPKELSKSIPKGRILSESEWRGIGVQQSRGWEHYACHRYATVTVVCVAVARPHCAAAQGTASRCSRARRCVEYSVICVSSPCCGVSGADTTLPLLQLSL